MKVQIRKSTLALDATDLETLVSVWKGQQGVAIAAVGVNRAIRPDGYVVRLTNGREVVVLRRYLAREVGSTFKALAS